MPELDTYRRKRDAARTPEPVPDSHAPTSDHPGNRFVIQEHHATALHWDFRLERDGVLVSWAVPKNLPVDPDTNHLAVHTEDHPLDYIDFAGEIPEGEYGGGSVAVWDTGSYECEKWSEREVKVVLSGEKVSGRYVLFKTGKRDRDWMVHRMDPPAEGYEPLPKELRPMLATTTDKLPSDDASWGYEFKWDGVRAMVWVDGGRPRAMSRNDRDITGSYPELRAMAEALGSRQLVLDGELIAFDAAGRPSFGALQSRMHVTKSAQVRRLMDVTPVTFVAFDLLHLDGASLVGRPYAERRELLDSLALSGRCWQTSPWFAGGGEAVLAASVEQQLEGVVAKRLDSAYSPGARSRSWLKLKNVRTQAAVVVGWKPGEGRRSGTVGSLLLAIPDDDGGLQYAGHVGSGFTERMLTELHKALEPLARKDSPLASDIARADAKNAHWVDPTLVGEVRFSEWTRDGRLRHPVWRGLREDTPPEDVRRES